MSLHRDCVLVNFDYDQDTKTKSKISIKNNINIEIKFEINNKILIRNTKRVMIRICIKMYFYI